MTNHHPIVPSPEQVDQWFNDAVQLNSTPKYYIATQAAQWGADQELEADCKWLFENAYPHKVASVYLRKVRRPEPPTLKEQALELVRRIEGTGSQWALSELGVVRRALEALDD
jgi:hypothetical protein